MEKPQRNKMSHLPAAVAECLARHEASEQLVYKKKMKMLKKMIKRIVLENAALCDLVSSVQQEVAVASEERKFLIRKLSQYQSYSEMSCQSGSYKATVGGIPETTEGSSSGRFIGESNLSKLGNKAIMAKRKLLGSCGGSVGQTPSAQSISALCGAPEKARHKKTAKPKKLCPPIPLDSAGRPIFPIVLGELKIYSLGEIVTDRETYHEENVIYPVGFCSSRLYANAKNPTKTALYTCTVKDGGLYPRFEIVAEDDDDCMFSGQTAGECHRQLLERISESLGFELLPTSSMQNERGLLFVGLTHPSIQNVLQACPGARKLSKYKWIKFEICKNEFDLKKCMEAESEASICHRSLLRNIRFANHHIGS